MCECFTVGGPFMGEDPDCPIHGRDAQARAKDGAEAHQELSDRIASLERTVAALVKIVSPNGQPLTEPFIDEVPKPTSQKGRRRVRN